MSDTYSMMKKLRSFKRDESGVVLIIVTVFLIVLLGLASLSIDVGYMMVVHNELQNAADAAALSGAQSLWYNNTSETPDWSTAQTEASTAAPPNKAAGTTVVDYEVQPGYWNLDHTPYGLQPTSITPGTNDASAVKVTARRAAGHNGGPLKTFFASAIGIKTVGISATATAVSDAPHTANPGTLLPIAISRAVADQKSSHNTPGTAFRIGTSYHYPTSMAGQWTSFTTDSNNVPTIRDLIANGNPDPLSIGTNIWIEPGTKTTLYNSIPVGTDVVLPIVDAVLSDVTHSAVPVFGFIGFHITASVGGSGKYIEGYFLDNIKIEGSPGGPHYGVYVPPKLVQ